MRRTGLGVFASSGVNPGGYPWAGLRTLWVMTSTHPDWVSVCSHGLEPEVSPLLNIFHHPVTSYHSEPEKTDLKPKPRTSSQPLIKHPPLTNHMRIDRVEFAMPREHTLLGKFPGKPSFACIKAVKSRNII